MSQFLTFFLVELKTKLKQAQLYLYMFFLALPAFVLLYFSDKINVGINIGNINLNSSFSILVVFAALGSLAIFFLPTLVSATATQDFDNNFYEILFTVPLKKFAYFFGRFLAVWLSSIIVFVPVFVACVLAFQFVEPDRLGESFSYASFLQPYWLYVIPNAFIITALTFSAAIIFRHIIAVYSVVMLLISCYSIATAFLGAELQYQELASYFDPFGFAALQCDSLYWTISDKNVKIYQPTTLMTLNRLLWVGIALGALISSYFAFSFSKSVSQLFGKSKKAEDKTPVYSIFPKPLFKEDYSLIFSVKTLISRTWLEYNSVLRNVSFFLIAGFGLIILVINLYHMGGKIYGISSFPVSYLMAEFIKSTNLLFGTILAIFFAGQMVWADRDQKTSDVSNALPLPSWAWVSSKIIALWMVIYTLQSINIAVCISYQLLKGYYSIELLPYLEINLFLEASALCFWAALAVMLQVVINQKALGYLVCIVTYFLPRVISQMGFDHLLLHPWDMQNMVMYSDMNGIFPYIREIKWFKTYLAEITAIVFLISIVFWVRSRDQNFGFRLKLALKAFSNKNIWVASAVVLVCLGCTAGKIYYDTVIVNKHNSNPELMVLEKVNFEKKYKKFASRPQPRITNTVYNIELYPSQETIEVNGVFTLVNKNAEKIDTIHVFCPEKKATKISIVGAREQINDPEHNYIQLQLNKPLKPGDSVLLSFSCNYKKTAMENWAWHNDFTQNGTFFNKMSFAPTIGYPYYNELADKWQRKKYGLDEQDKLARNTDSLAMMRTYFSPDADFGHIKATIGTDKDQIAVAPGDLIKKEMKNGRAYFTYQSSEPVLNFYSFLSARYTVATEKYEDISIEVYHHPTHTRNVPRMLKAMKDAIAFSNANYSPYKYKQARIVEFPRYNYFAQAFAGTMPYSEGIGFIHDIDKENDLDLVYYTVAHEIAHQWWGHQVASANVEGCTFMVETMAQYTALQVMEKEYGPDKMKTFLKYEMNNYLLGRGTEREKELPIIRNQNQDYIHYKKGSVVMYCLGKYVGFDKINAALGAFIKKNYHKSAPYPTAFDLYKSIKNVVPDSLQYLCEDMFEKITLYDNRTTDAVYEKLPDGKYKAYFSVSCAKFNADSVGLEKIRPINDYIEIAVTDKENKSILKKRVKITKERTDFEWILNQKPEKAAIDPDYLLIDRIPADNYREFKASEILN